MAARGPVPPQIAEGAHLFPHTGHGDEAGEVVTPDPPGELAVRVHDRVELGPVPGERSGRSGPSCSADAAGAGLPRRRVPSTAPLSRRCPSAARGPAVAIRSRSAVKASVRAFSAFSLVATSPRGTVPSVPGGGAARATQRRTA